MCSFNIILFSVDSKFESYRKCAKCIGRHECPEENTALFDTLMEEWSVFCDQDQVAGWLTTSKRCFEDVFFFFYISRQIANTLLLERTLCAPVMICTAGCSGSRNSISFPTNDKWSRQNWKIDTFIFGKIQHAKESHHKIHNAKSRYS